MSQAQRIVLSIAIPFEVITKFDLIFYRIDNDFNQQDNEFDEDK